MILVCHLLNSMVKNTITITITITIITIITITICLTSNPALPALAISAMLPAACVPVYRLRMVVHLPTPRLPSPPERLQVAANAAQHAAAPALQRDTLPHVGHTTRP